MWLQGGFVLLCVVCVEVVQGDKEQGAESSMF